MAKKGKLILYTGKKAQSLLKKEGFKKIKYSQLKEVKGIRAFSGKVSGRVIIIRDLNDLKNKKVRNKIIVSLMTVPAFNPYLKKAKAIVTDEGGITCHAAIVAREFKIPCMVGTKIATKVLKDGNLVEVDATRGLVRKLN